jgi:hypothetical protein
MKVVVNKTILESLMKKLLSENRSYRSPRIDYIEGKGIAQEPPVLPNPQIPSISQESVDIDDPELEITNVKALTDAAATIARVVPHGQENYFYNKMKDMLADVESRDRSKKFMQEMTFLRERELLARNRFYKARRAMIMTEAESSGVVPPPSRPVAEQSDISKATEDLFNLLSIMTEPKHVKDLFEDPELERYRVSIYTRARNAMRAAPRDYFALTASARLLIQSILENEAAIDRRSESKTGLKANPETVYAPMLSDLAEKIDKLAIPPGTTQSSAEYMQKLTVPHQSVLPPAALLEDEELGTLFSAIQDAFLKNKEAILQDLVKGSDYVKLGRKKISRRVAKSRGEKEAEDPEKEGEDPEKEGEDPKDTGYYVSSYYTKGFYVQFDTSQHDKFNLEIEDRQKITNNVDKITQDYIQTDPAVMQELSGLETSPAVGRQGKILADPDIANRVDVFVKILFSPFTRALASVGRDLDISANRQLDMIYRGKSGGNIDRFVSEVENLISGLGDSVRDDILGALLKVKLEGMLESEIAEKAKIGEEQAYVSTATPEPVIPDLSGTSPDFEAMPESPDFTRNLAALAPLFGFADAPGLRQWMRKYPWKILRFQLMGTRNEIPGYASWVGATAQALEPLVGAISDSIDEIYDSVYDQEIKQYLSVCLADIVDLEMAIQDVSDSGEWDGAEEFRRILNSTVGGILVRDINSKLFIHPSIRDYPGAIEVAGRQFLSSQGIIDPAGTLSKMMKGEIDMPKSLRTAKPAQYNKLYSINVGDAELEKIRNFVDTWTGRWLQGEATEILQKAREVTANKSLIRREVLAAVPGAKKELEYIIARRRLMNPETESLFDIPGEKRDTIVQPEAPKETLGAQEDPNEVSKALSVALVQTVDFNKDLNRVVINVSIKGGVRRVVIDLSEVDPEAEDFIDVDTAEIAKVLLEKLGLPAKDANIQYLLRYDQVLARKEAESARSEELKRAGIDQPAPPAKGKRRKMPTGMNLDDSIFKALMRVSG